MQPERGGIGPLCAFVRRDPPGGETALAPLWHQTAEQLKQRSLVVILSDCFGDTADLLRALQHLRHRRHEVLLFHVLAPEEMEFPFKKWTQFRSLELADDRRLVDPQSLRKEYLANFERFRRELRDACGKTQVDYHLIRTDEPAPPSATWLAAVVVALVPIAVEPANWALAKKPSAVAAAPFADDLAPTDMAPSPVAKAFD